MLTKNEYMNDDLDISENERINKILKLIIHLTKGDYDAREEISEKGDDFDSIIVGLNTLGEELKAKEENG